MVEAGKALVLGGGGPGLPTVGMVKIEAAETGAGIIGAVMIFAAFGLLMNKAKAVANRRLRIC